jgi:hypothetical protein
VLKYSTCQRIRDINDDDVLFHVIHWHLFGRNEKDDREKKNVTAEIDGFIGG